MTRARRALLSAFFLVILGGQVFDVVTKREDWPFSSYPMYSGARAGRVTRTEVVGVGANGEFPLTPERHFPPLDNTRFQRALMLLRRDPNPTARQQAAIDVLVQRYEEARRAGRHDDPPLVALRTYESAWTLQSGAHNREVPDSRVLRFEVRMTGGDGENGQ